MTIYDDGGQPAITRRAAAGLDVVPMPGGTVQIRGSWDECSQAVALAIRSGRMLRSEPIRPDGAGRYLLTMRLAPQPRLLAVTVAQPWWRDQPGLAVAFLVVLLFLLGLGGWAVAVVLPVLPELAKIVAGVAVLVALGWFGLGQVSACPGLHCPGCKCGRG